jgi:hypothetical protein
MRIYRKLAPDGAGTTVHVRLTFRRRGGRKRIVMPDGAPAWAPRPAHVDGTLLKAVARAHRWRAMLEGGEVGSVTDLAAAEKINASYLARVLRLTLLAPDIVDQISTASTRAGSMRNACSGPFPPEWEAQRRALLSR